MPVKKKRSSRLFRTLKPYLFVAPGIALLLLFTYYPMLDMVYLSFFDYNLITEKKFVGWENYRRLLFVNVDFWNSLRNTAVFTVANVAFLIVLGLLLALWLQKSTKFNAMAQRLMYLPNFVSMLSVTLIFEWLMAENGVFNAVLKFFNMPGLRWLESSDTALMCIIIISIWKGVGSQALLLLGTLNAIPEEINEAAALDNAKPLQRFFKITLPMISPQLFYMVITNLMASFKVFESVRILTNGGPGNSTDVLVFYIYRYAFQSMKVGYASAAGCIMAVILMIFSIYYFRTLSKHVHYQ